ncbi:hypothetical protein Neosp_014181 [[Neocosmospora] mangrovei]
MSMLARVTADPKLPLANPTQAYWQRVPHALARVASPTLPATTDVAIIGSGITGMSAARTILESGLGVRVSVFEARELCSGATGRNGGQLAINSAETYEATRDLVGPQMAGKMVRFNLRTLEKTREIIQKYNIEDAQLVNVKKLRACLDTMSWEKIRRGVEVLERDHPSLKGIYEVVDGSACKEKFGIQGAKGGVLLPAGTVWPYRLVCSVFQILLDAHGDLLNVETNTPVTHISHDPSISTSHPYQVITPRGTVRAKHVIHCVNGYTGHLLPNLRGPIFPLTGTMTVQDLGPSGPRQAQTTSWAIHREPDMGRDGLFHDGLQYLAQNARSNLFFMGGDKIRLAESISAKDDKICPNSVDFLRSELSTLFGMDKDGSNLISAWSGVMGFSADGMPIAGRLPSRITDRDGDGEWVAAAFNGYGMSSALSVGEAVANWVMGNPVDSSFPEAFMVTDARLKGSLTTEATMRALDTLVGTGGDQARL